MKALPFATCWALLSLTAVQAEAAATITLRNLRANVEIVPEDRPDISVRVEADGSPDALPVVSRAGDAVTVEGTVATGQRGYRVSFNLDRGMNIAAMKRRSHLDRPHPAGLCLIVIHTPMKVKVKSNAYVFGHVGPGQSVDVNDSGDGEWRVDPVTETLSVKGSGGTDFHLATSRSAAIDMLGTGNVSLGNTQSLYVSQYGSGDIVAETIAHDIDVSLSGIGDFEAKSVSGVMRVLITDAGNVRIQDGDITKLTVRTIDGVGAVQFGGTVKDVDVNIGTATKVHIHKVTGAIRKSTRERAALEIDEQ